jgi:uncharacterized protein DUF5658
LSTIVLLTIATFDLVTTLLWLTKGQMEGNQFFAMLASHGLVVLVLGKLVFLFIPVAMLEYARSKRPLSGEIGTWIAAAGYAYLYVGHILQLREHLSHGRH